MRKVLNMRSSIAAAVAPHIGKIMKNIMIILKKEKFATKWYIILAVRSNKSIVRNCVEKIELLQNFLKRDFNAQHLKGCLCYTYHL